MPALRAQKYAVYKFYLLFLLVTIGSATPAYAFSAQFIVQTGTPQTNNVQRVISSAPYENQVLDKSPATVEISFSQPVLPDKSALKVLDSFGTLLTEEQPDSTGRNLFVQLPELSSGRYSVRWRARCRCDDDSELSGSYHFTVK